MELIDRNLPAFLNVSTLRFFDFFGRCHRLIDSQIWKKWFLWTLSVYRSNEELADWFALLLLGIDVKLNKWNKQDFWLVEHTPLLMCSFSVKFRERDAFPRRNLLSNEYFPFNCHRFHRWNYQFTVRLVNQQTNPKSAFTPSVVRSFLCAQRVSSGCARTEINGRKRVPLSKRETTLFSSPITGGFSLLNEIQRWTSNPGDSFHVTKWFERMWNE